MITYLKIKTFAQLSGELVYDLLALRGRVFVVEQNSACLDADGRDKTAWHVLIFDELDHLQAAARILPGDGKENLLAIGRVVVAPEYRGRGLGRDLMQAAIDCCQKEYGDTPIRLSAQRHLTSFYRSLGFAVTSDPYREDGIWHVAMVRDPHQGGAAPSPSDDSSQIWTIGQPQAGAWLIETPQRFLLFDYGVVPARHRGRREKGGLSLDSLPPKPMFAFATSPQARCLNLDFIQHMAHRSHSLAIVGADEKGSLSLPAGALPVTARDSLLFDGIQVDCSGSTVAGVSFLARLPEGLVYHAGSLELVNESAACRKVFAAETSWLSQCLATAGRALDLAILPIGDPKEASNAVRRRGLWQMIDCLRPRFVLPMSSGQTTEELDRFRQELKARPPQPGTWIPQVIDRPDASEIFSLDLREQDSLVF